MRKEASGTHPSTSLRAAGYGHAAADEAIQVDQSECRMMRELSAEKQVFKVAQLSAIDGKLRCQPRQDVSRHEHERTLDERKRTVDTLVSFT
jgi:hypothetical protein